jgi:hypothetical protein
MALLTRAAPRLSRVLRIADATACGPALDCRASAARVGQELRAGRGLPALTRQPDAPRRFAVVSPTVVVMTPRGC